MKIFYILAMFFFGAFTLRAVNVYESTPLTLACIVLFIACFMGYLYSKELQK